MLQDLIQLQSGIYSSFADQINHVAGGEGWRAFWTYLPMGILFGAAHALTPGHNKAALATYVTGSSAGFLRGTIVSVALAIVHIATSVIIALLALRVVSVTIANVGQAPALEYISRVALGAIGVWMIYRATRTRRRRHHDRLHGVAMGAAAGLVPCPLTLFVMMFAMSRQVPAAGVAFAGAMAIGVAITLIAVAMIAICCRKALATLLLTHPESFDRASRVLEGGSGLVLLILACLTVSR